jgi:hypothetical protein
MSSQALFNHATGRCRIQARAAQASLRDHCLGTFCRKLESANAEPLWSKVNAQESYHITVCGDFVAVQVGPTGPDSHLC